MMGNVQRTYLVHVPKKYTPEKPAPVVLALHGGGMKASEMVSFSGLNAKADEAGFIVVYPTGAGSFPMWNAGGFVGKLGEGQADDVAFISKLLDDLNTVVKVDEKRVYACGYSHGGLMCYRLAAELSEWIAAIAPVAGTLALDECKPKRPVPVIHFHGTKDAMIPFDKATGTFSAFIKLKSVPDSITRAPTERSVANDEWLARATRAACAPEMVFGRSGESPLLCGEESCGIEP